MTEFQHAIVGMVVFMVIWHLFIKRYFATEKDHATWQAIISKWLSGE